MCQLYVPKASCWSVGGSVGRLVSQLFDCFIIYLFIHLFAELKQDALHTLHLEPCTFTVPRG
jgi:hypothetical protein